MPLATFQGCVGQVLTPGLIVGQVFTPGLIAIYDVYRAPAKETPLGAICLPSYRAMHAGHIIGALLPKNKRPSSLLADQIVPHSLLCQKV